MAKPEVNEIVPVGTPLVHAEVVSVAISGRDRTSAEKAFDIVIATVDAKLDKLIALVTAQGASK